MRPRRARVGGVAAVLGGVLEVVTNVPPGWYGATASDSYVFSPPAFTPLWVERVVMPPLVVLGVTLLAVGLGALVVRDWPRAGRFRKGGGVAAVGGIAMLAVALWLLQMVRTSGDLGGILAVFGGLGIGALGLLLAVPGLLALGYGYTRTRRPRIGYALLAAPLLAIVLVALPGGVGGAVLTVLPVLGAWLVVGHDLWHHSEPLDESDDGESSDATGEDDPWVGDDAADGDNPDETDDAR